MFNFFQKIKASPPLFSYLTHPDFFFVGYLIRLHLSKLKTNNHRKNLKSFMKKTFQNVRNQGTIEQGYWSIMVTWFNFEMEFTKLKYRRLTNNKTTSKILICKNLNLFDCVKLSLLSTFATSFMVGSGRFAILDAYKIKILHQ